MPLYEPLEVQPQPATPETSGIHVSELSHEGESTYQVIKSDVKFMSKIFGISLLTSLLSYFVLYYFKFFKNKLWLSVFCTLISLLVYVISIKSIKSVHVSDKDLAIGASILTVTNGAIFFLLSYLSRSQMDFEKVSRK